MAKKEAGRTAAAGALRRKLFVEAYLTNGHHLTNAAIAAGLSAATAGEAGCRMMKHPEVKALIAERTKQVLFDAQLSTERWAAEIACIGHFDPAQLYDAAGNLIPIRDLPEHVRRAISGVKLTDNGTEYKIADKNTALATIGRHLGAFEVDNRQKAQPIQVVIQLVG